MKIVVAFIGSFMMFVMTWLLVAILLAVWVPYTQKQIVFEYLVTNIASLTGFIVGGLVATQTFRASLKARTGKLYREEDSVSQEKRTD
jgi:membrane associated rhomboid family serine protease